MPSRYFGLSITEDPRFERDPEKKRILEARIDEKIRRKNETIEKDKNRELLRDLAGMLSKSESTNDRNTIRKGNTIQNGELAPTGEEQILLIMFVFILFAFFFVAMPTRKFAAKKVRRKSRHKKRV